MNVRRTIRVVSILLLAATAAVAQSAVLDVYNVATRTMRHITVPAQASAGLGLRGGFHPMPPNPRLLADPAMRARLQAMLARRPKDVDHPQQVPGATKAAKASGILGTFHALVLLVDFSDHTAQYYPGTKADAHYRQMLFSRGTFPTGSMRDYYLENSYNQFQVTGDVSGGASGWYRAPQTYAYYVDGNNGFNSYPRNAQGLVTDLVELADPDVDYTKYDNDHDGWVDSLFVVHSGPGAEATGSWDDIWSHMWGIPPVTLDGVNVCPYSIEPEDGTIGVFCHEYGHILGAYDLYDYGNDTAGYDSAGLGVWSVMAAGSWGADYNHPNRPSQFDAFHKIMFGWIRPTILTADQKNVSIPSVETAPTVYQLGSAVKRTGDYFLVENRQKTGFDSLLPNAGLLIYHIDRAMLNSTVNDSEWFPGLPLQEHYAVAVEQADARWDLEHNFNVGDAGDPYPGTANNRAFSAASLPDSTSYYDGPTGMSVSNISDSGETMTADIALSLPRHAQWYVNASTTGYGNGLSQDRPYATIGEAMAAARVGDTINVAPGVYTETVNFAGKEVTLSSSNPQDANTVANTIIRAGANGASVLFRHAEHRTAVLDGFTISHLPGITGSGINIMGAAPTIRNCVLRGNTDNRAGEDLSFGGGILALDGANPLVVGNRFEGNAADVGAGVCLLRAGAELRDNTFTGNRATYDGGGVAMVRATAGAVVQGCVFTDDEAKRGGGLFCSESSPVVSDCSFKGCLARNQGGAIHLREGSSAQIRRAAITNCRAILYTFSRGGGLYCVLGSNAVIDGLSLWGCTAPQGAGLFSNSDSAPVITNSIIAGCTGPGIQAQQALAVTYSDVWGNTGKNVIGFAYPGGSNGNLSADPRFADAAAGDMHLKSRVGRFTEGGTWVQDTVSSPCLDGGDPQANVGAEPSPNGARLDMGAYGGTAQASQSVRDTILSGYWPATGAANVEVRPTVRLYFREPVVEASAEGHFSLTLPTTSRSVPVVGVLGRTRWLQPGKVMAFTPTDPLPTDTVCQATIDAGIEKQDGGVTSWSEHFSFTTAECTVLAGVSALAVPTANGGAQITVNLAASAQVSAEIINLAGTTVATLAPREAAAGVNTLLWDGRSTRGTKVPAGQYLVRVQALGANGSASSCLAALKR